MEESHSFCFVQSANIFRKGLGGNPDGFHLIPALFEGSFRLMEHLKGGGNLRLVMPSIDPNEGRDGPNLRFLPWVVTSCVERTAQNCSHEKWYEDRGFPPHTSKIRVGEAGSCKLP
jgi:hypothetical protein